MTGHVAVVTGASRGIGRATALCLAEAGADIVAVARDRAGLAETREAVSARGRQCMVAALDMGDAAAVDGLFNDIVSRMGRVDVVVNNAGQAVLSPIESFDTSEFDAMLDINVRAVFYTTRACWPLMMQAGGGTIVNISSRAATDPFPGFQAYGACKAWVEAFTRSSAAEGRPHDIRVYAIAPGAVDTPMLRAHFPDFPADQCLTPDDVARTIAWVLKPESAHASGAVVAVCKS